jgi:ABC-type transporter Mla MlaB component
VIDGDLTIRYASRRRVQLLDWLAQARPDEALDVAQVKACDTAGLQLLLALRRSRAEQGLGLGLCHPTAALTEVLQRSGLSDLLVGNGRQD